MTFNDSEKDKLDLLFKKTLGFNFTNSRLTVAQQSLTNYYINNSLIFSDPIPTIANGSLTISSSELIDTNTGLSYEQVTTPGFSHIRKYNEITLKFVRNTIGVGTGGSWEGNNDVQKELLTRFIYNVQGNMSPTIDITNGATITNINIEDSAYKPIVNAGIIIFTGNSTNNPIISSTTIKLKNFFIYDGSFGLNEIESDLIVSRDSQYTISGTGAIITDKIDLILLVNTTSVIASNNNNEIVLATVQTNNIMIHGYNITNEPIRDISIFLPTELDPDYQQLRLVKYTIDNNPHYLFFCIVTGTTDNFYGDDKSINEISYNSFNRNRFNGFDNLNNQTFLDMITHESSDISVIEGDIIIFVTNVDNSIIKIIRMYIPDVSLPQSVAVYTAGDGYDNNVFYETALPNLAQTTIMKIIHITDNLYIIFYKTPTEFAELYYIDMGNIINIPAIKSTYIPSNIINVHITKISMAYGNSVLVIATNEYILSFTVNTTNFIDSIPNITTTTSGLDDVIYNNNQNKFLGIESTNIYFSISGSTWINESLNNQVTPTPTYLAATIINNINYIVSDSDSDKIFEFTFSENSQIITQTNAIINNELIVQNSTLQSEGDAIIGIGRAHPDCAFFANRERYIDQRDNSGNSQGHALLASSVGGTFINSSGNTGVLITNDGNIQHVFHANGSVSFGTDISSDTVTLTVSGSIHNTGAITSTGTITGGAITCTSLNTGNGTITGGAITCTSLNTGNGTINGGAITGRSLNVTNGNITVRGNLLMGSHHKSNYTHTAAFIAASSCYNARDHGHGILMLQNGATLVNSSNTQPVVIAHQNSYTHAFHASGNISFGWWNDDSTRRLSVFGNIFANGQITPSSDNRLKHNEINITNGLNIINQLQPQFYQKTNKLLDANYNGDLSGYDWYYEAGLIAQDLLNSDISYVVIGGDYYDKSNNLVENAYSVNYNSVFIYVLAAVKELDIIIKNQQTSITNQQTIITNQQTIITNQQTTMTNQQTTINELNNKVGTLEYENLLIKSALNELLSEAGKNTI